MEQGGTAKKLTGQILENWLVHMADGHGGIQSITRVGTSGLVDTYRITYADTTTSTFTVTNGKAIQSIVKTPAVAPSLTDSYRINYNDGTNYDFDVDNGRGISNITWTTSGTAGDGQVHTGTITYNDGTASTIVFTDGVKGDTGDAVYTHIKYASQQPTEDADMGDVPDDWMGIYTGTSESAPTHYTDYAWYQIKGAKGNTGDAATITNASVMYLEGTSGTVAPEGGWSTTIPTITPGNFLWTRTILPFNDGTTVISYSVARFGIDGAGSVSTVAGVSPDTSGNVPLVASDIPASNSMTVQQHLDDLTTELETAVATQNLKTYSTVTQLGLTDGFATVVETYAKMPNGSLLMCAGERFESASRPPASSSVEIFRPSSGASGGHIIARCIDGKRVWRMAIASNQAQGVWIAAPTLDDIRYSIGQSVNINATLSVIGQVDTEGKRLFLHVPIPKSTPAGATITVSAFRGTIWTMDSKRLEGRYGTYDWKADATYSFSVTNFGGPFVRVGISKTSVFTADGTPLPENTMIGAWITSIGLTIS